MIHPLTVLGFGSVAPYAGSVDLRSEVERERPVLDLALLERTLRRGLSEVTRLFMHASKLALSDAARRAETHPSELHVIFASAFGEIATAEALLAEAYDENGSSPARFSRSVHNTAPGLFSISTKNYLPCTAVAAGWETPAMALLEAAAQLAEQASASERVLLVFAEERVPTALSAEHNYGALAAAFVLGRADAASAAGHATLSVPKRRARTEMPLIAGTTQLAHPLAPVLALARMLERREVGTLAVSDGDTPWCIEVSQAQASAP